MRVGFLLATIVLAFALGIVAGTSESRLLTRALVIGVVPAIWTLSHALERLTGNDMWHFTAPYPDRWTREEGETTTPRPSAIRESVDEPVEAKGPSPLPVAA
jgi:hypothetical protein